GDGRVFTLEYPERPQSFYDNAAGFRATARGRRGRACEGGGLSVATGRASRLGVCPRKWSVARRAAAHSASGQRSVSQIGCFSTLVDPRPAPSALGSFWPRAGAASRVTAQCSEQSSILKFHVNSLGFYIRASFARFRWWC